MKRKKIIISLLFVLLIAVGISLYFLLNKENKIEKPNEEEKLSIKESITLEINSSLLNINDFFDKEISDEYTIRYYLNNEEISFVNIYNKIGQYDVIITINNNEYKSKLIINDTTKPELKLKEVIINEGEEYKIEDFITTCTDNSGEECILEYKTTENYSKEGVYDVTIIAKDSSNNIIEASTKLTINKIPNQVNNPLEKPVDVEKPTVSRPKFVETKKEVSTSQENYKYGIKIIKTTTTTYDLYSDGTIKNKKTNTKTSYDTSSYKANAKELLPEAISNRSTYSKQVEEVLNYTNIYRQEVGLKPLVIDENLNKVAMIRALEMGYANKLEHIRPNGDFCFSVSDELGFGEFWGENLAWGQSSAKGATTWWRNSLGHYYNMIGNYTKLGVGVFKYNGRYLWVQVFA